jgi:hypothetical protein
MTFTFHIQTPDGPKDIGVAPGSTILIVGANGGGKTRLATHIESQLELGAHRIAGHRALTLNPEVAKISERAALSGLRTGYANENASAAHRHGHRYSGEPPEIALLSDFNFLVQALFAEQANTALDTHRDARARAGTVPKTTKFEQLQEIWNRLLPHRVLNITGDNITVSIPDEEGEYPAKQLSDGERAIFYLIGQTLVAAPNCVLIFDEPELHVHRAILGTLWDELEAARPDCAFVVISHDLEFVASRRGTKYVALNYRPASGWTIEEVPEESGFTEEITTLILGSRKPVLFVEGSDSSLDSAIYRSCYPSWTIIPRGSCEEVIHAVTTFRANKVLTRVHCAGIVDADDYSNEEANFLATRGIAILPVSEVENLLVHPTVLNAVLWHEGYRGRELSLTRERILDAVFAHADETKNKRGSILRYCRRRIDRVLKKVDLSVSKDVDGLKANYAAATAALDIAAIASLAEDKINAAISSRDAALLLRWYDNKGLMSIACEAKGSNVGVFEQWIVRSLRNDAAPRLKKSISRLLPSVV